MKRRRVARLGSPTWVEASMPQPGAVTQNATSSSPKATTMLTEGDASRPPLYPHGMRAFAATYASSVSTNMSAYEALPGHHLLSIHNLIASTPDSSYLDSADEGSVPAQDYVNPEWDYSGIRDLEAFLSFQAAADYCLACSDDSSEGDYDPTRECFIAVLGGHNSDTDDNIVVADAAHATTAAAGATAAPKPPTPASAAEQQAQLTQLQELEAKLKEERRHSQKLRHTLEQERAGRGTKAREAGRDAQQQILAYDREGSPLILPEASQKITAAALMIRAMPESSTPEGRNLRKEAQALLEDAAV